MIRILVAAALLMLGGSTTAPLQAVGGSRSSPLLASERTDRPPEQTAIGQPRVLQPGRAKSVSIPPIPAFGEPKCDSRGNLYFALGGNTHRLGSLLELSHDGLGSTAFAPRVPEKLDPLGEIGFRDFNVTPSGEVYELLQNQNDRGIVLVKFDSGGRVQRSTRVAAVEGLQARSLAVFDDGAILVRGYIRLGHGENAARAYVALFDAGGTLRKEFIGFPDLDLASERTSLRDGGMTVGQDGNAYLLDANLISVISESGESARRVPYRKPNPALVARTLRVSDGLIAVGLVQINGAELTRKSLVVNAETGETVGYYALPDETEEVGMCFSRRDGFTFLIQQDAKLALVNAPLR